MLLTLEVREGRGLLDVLRGQVGDEVVLARLEAGQTSATLRDELVADAADRRCAAPIVGVGGELDRDAGLAADEGVRAGAVGGIRKVSDVLGCRGNDLQPVHARREHAVGTVGGDPNRQVVDRLGAGERTEEAVVVGFAGGDECHDALDRCHDSVGRERGAVMEADTLAELELPGGVVDLRRQFGCEAGLEFTRGRTCEQRLVDVVVDRSLATVIDDVRVEAGRLRAESNDDRCTLDGRSIAAVGGLVGRCCCRFWRSCLVVTAAGGEDEAECHKRAEHA